MVSLNKTEKSRTSSDASRRSNGVSIEDAVTKNRDDVTKRRHDVIKRRPVSEVIKQTVPSRRSSAEITSSSSFSGNSSNHHGDAFSYHSDTSTFPRSTSLGVRPKTAGEKLVNSDLRPRTGSLKIEKVLNRELRGGSVKLPHDLRKKKKKPVISGPLYIEPINGREFKKSPPFSKRDLGNLPMRQESFSAFLEQEVFLSSVMLAQHQQNREHLRGVPSDHGPRATEAISFNEEDDTCACVSHYDNEHLNQEFDLSIEKLYKSLFNDESVVQSKMRTLLKAEDYEATSWHDSEEGASERTLTYRVPLSANLGPKWAEVIEKQVLTTTSVAAKCYVINCEVTNPNVPYGDKFNIVKRYCLTRGRDNTCKLRLTSDVQYKKGVWGMVKSIIEKNSKEGIKEYCEDLCMCLQEESAGPGIKIRKSAVSGGAHTSAASTRLPRARSHAALPDNQSRATTAVSFVTDNYIAFVLLMMAVLMVLNLVLVYRLSSITSSCNNQFDILSSLPQSEEGKSEWIRILSQQQDLHKKEIQRWQDVLRWISKLVSEVHGSLEKLQKSSIYMGSSGYHDTTGSNWDTSDKTDL